MEPAAETVASGGGPRATVLVAVTRRRRALYARVRTLYYIISVCIWVAIHTDIVCMGAPVMTVPIADGAGRRA